MLQLPALTQSQGEQREGLLGTLSTNQTFIQFHLSSRRDSDSSLKGEHNSPSQLLSGGNEPL